MSASRVLSEIRERRIVVKAAGIGAGSLLGAQAVVVASLAGIDWWKQRGRKQRDAPRPGTYTAQVQDSELTIYTSGEDVYKDMLEAIDGAERSVHMETFIWKNDEIGQRFLDGMNRAAERGVDVFVIYDGFANLVVPQTFYRFDSKVHVFRMPFLRRPFWKGPLRFSGLNHSKILVVDDEIGFVGGFNIGSMYSRQWRDTHIREVGPAVWGLRNAVATVWNEDREPGTAIEWVPPKSWDPEVRVNANLPIQIVYPIREMYMNAIDRAQDHIWINTPYFIPDQQVLDTLLDAAARGVDVRIMVPKDSNHILADWVSRGFYGQLLRGGVTILLYAASMIHSKTATIDGEWSTVGTANLDRLSLSFNYETNVEIVDPDFAAQMEKVFLADSEHCEELTSPRWRERHPMARVAEVLLVPLRPLL
nr:phospholipase D-like domain-containing protein [Kocuria rhizophila]